MQEVEDYWGRGSWEEYDYDDDDDSNDLPLLVCSTCFKPSAESDFYLDNCMAFTSLFYISNPKSKRRNIRSYCVVCTAWQKVIYSYCIVSRKTRCFKMHGINICSACFSFVEFLSTPTYCAIYIEFILRKRIPREIFYEIISHIY